MLQTWVSSSRISASPDDKGGGSFHNVLYTKYNSENGQYKTIFLQGTPLHRTGIISFDGECEVTKTDLIYH